MNDWSAFCPIGVCQLTGIIDIFLFTSFAAVRSLIKGFCQKVAIVIYIEEKSAYCSAPVLWPPVVPCIEEGCGSYQPT